LGDPKEAYVEVGDTSTPNWGEEETSSQEKKDFLLTPQTGKRKEKKGAEGENTRQAKGAQVG